MADWNRVGELSEPGGDDPHSAGAAGAKRPNLLMRWWIWCWGLVVGLTVWLLDTIILIFQVLFSKDGLVWVGVTLVLGSAFFGWIQTPLQNVIRAYAFTLFGQPAVSDALTNPFHVLSYGVVCLLAVAIVSAGAALRWPHWLRRHVGAGLLLVLLAFPVSLVARHHLVLEQLVEQSRERANIMTFAVKVGGYAAHLPTSEYAGTASLLDRALTARDVIGYGWWFAWWGTVLLVAAGFVGARGLRPGWFVAGWGGAILLVLVVLAAPVVTAEWHRLRGEALYARAQYAQALARFQQAMSWAPTLRENRSLQQKIGATLYWLGDRTSAQSRFFLADNLQAQGEFARAELELTLAAASDPDWRLPRRTLAELNAAWGVHLFRGTGSGAVSRWERALKLDDSLKSVRYYLTHAYYNLDDRDQTRALTYATRLVELAPERGMLADLYQRLGDIYFKAHRDEEARTMYRLSLQMIPLVKQLNLRAQRGLIGL